MTSWSVGGAQAAGGWFKSRFSNGQCACVEIRDDGATVSIRDSKFLRLPGADPAAQPVITVAAGDFGSWVAACEEDTAPFVAGPLLTSPTGDGGVTVCDRRTGVALTYTEAEWSAWRAGVEARSFVAV